MTNSELAREVYSRVEANVRSTPSAAEFEMAYQARVAIDRIRFAIKHVEQFAPQADQMQEAELQLLDALQRLENGDRRFQERSRTEKLARLNGTENGRVANSKAPSNELVSCPYPSHQKGKGGINVKAND